MHLHATARARVAVQAGELAWEGLMERKTTMDLTPEMAMRMEWTESCTPMERPNLTKLR
jgi:hypothetical protein